MNVNRGLSEADIRQMVHRLAHEIRNPLATIKSAAQLIDLVSHPTGEVAECLESIQTEVSRINRVIGDMQRYLRMEPQETVATDIEALVRSAVVSLPKEPEFDTSRVVVEGGPAASIQADPSILVSAIDELIDNALRFSPHEEPVIIRWRLVDDGMVAIEVDDRGPGIAGKHRDSILRPFFSTSTQGTGLGLNIAERAVQLTGGRLTWQNLAEGGARFTLIIPRV